MGKSAVNGAAPVKPFLMQVERPVTRSQLKRTRTSPATDGSGALVAAPVDPVAPAAMLVEDVEQELADTFSKAGPEEPQDLDSVDAGAASPVKARAGNLLKRARVPSSPVPEESFTPQGSKASVKENSPSVVTGTVDVVDDDSPAKVDVVPAVSMATKLVTAATKLATVLRIAPGKAKAGKPTAQNQPSATDDLTEKLATSKPAISKNSKTAAKNSVEEAAQATAMKVPLKRVSGKTSLVQNKEPVAGAAADTAVTASSPPASQMTGKRLASTELASQPKRRTMQSNLPSPTSNLASEPSTVLPSPTKARTSTVVPSPTKAATSSVASPSISPQSPTQLPAPSATKEVESAASSVPAPVLPSEQPVPTAPTGKQTLAASAESSSKPMESSKPTAHDFPALASAPSRPFSRSAGGTISELLSLTANVSEGAYGATRARLTALEIEDFKSFKRRALRFGDGLCCLVGSNSSGKSGVLDAIRFVLMRKSERSPRTFIRRGKPICSAARVTAHFQFEGGVVSLMREVKADPTAGKDGFTCAYWMSEGDKSLQEISEQRYRAKLSDSLKFEGGDLLVPQFGMMEAQSAATVLSHMPATLEKLSSVAASTGPLLKRRSANVADRPAATAAVSRIEAWLARRVDEVYRELTREPLDAEMEEWGEGGQAILRRVADGSFNLLVSTKRGAAASGYGTELQGLSDGARDICTLALLLAIPGLLAGMQDSLAPFVVLDEPDSRLDKRHARALRRFLSGPSGPKQCFWMSLNNHGAFPGDIHLDQEEVECAGLDLGLDPPSVGNRQSGTQSGSKNVIKARFLSRMSARLREEADADEDESDGL